MSADPIDFAPRLTILPSRAHGTHCEFLVFGMMSDIETTIRRELRSVAGHEAWPILQRLFDAHLRQLRLQFSDLWLDIDQPREKTLADLERLIDAGYVHREPTHDGAGALLAFTSRGAESAARLAQQISEIVAATCRKAGPDPFAK